MPTNRADSTANTRTLSTKTLQSHQSHTTTTTTARPFTNNAMRNAARGPEAGIEVHTVVSWLVVYNDLGVGTQYHATFACASACGWEEGLGGLVGWMGCVWCAHILHILHIYTHVVC